MFTAFSLFQGLAQGNDSCLATVIVAPDLGQPSMEVNFWIQSGAILYVTAGEGSQQSPVLDAVSICRFLASPALSMTFSPFKPVPSQHGFNFPIHQLLLRSAVMLDERGMRDTVELGTTLGNLVDIGSIALHSNYGVYRLQANRVCIGRLPFCEVSLPDASVSNIHAILVHRGRPKIYDLGSTNGTFVNRKKVMEDGKFITPGDTIRIGTVEIQVEDSNKSFRPLAGSHLSQILLTAEESSEEPSLDLVSQAISDPAYLQGLPSLPPV